MGLETLTLKVYDSDFLPSTFRNTKLKHYKKIFGEHYEEVYKESDKFNPKEKTFILSQDNDFVARCVLEYNKYDLRIRDFTVLKQFRGEGVASYFMKLLEQEAIKHNSTLLENKEKRYDEMFLRTYIYLDGDLLDESFEMGKFLRNMGFKPYKYNPKALSEEEKKALEAYTKINPAYKAILKVFKKSLRNNLYFGSVSEIDKELLKLDKRQREIVLKGLEGKLDCYDKRGFVSYRYDVCPICNDMKSSLEDNSGCEGCYIKNTCLEPFKEGFKEDSELSYIYFSVVKRYIKSIIKALKDEEGYIY